MSERQPRAPGESPYFTLRPPTAARAPVLVEVPHSGLAIPEAVRSELTTSPDAILRDADIYVDKLYDDATRAGATMLVARTSRYVVDLNRAITDVDPSVSADTGRRRGGQPRGVIWSLNTEGKSLLRRPLSPQQLQERVERFHKPYHRTLAQQMSALRSEFGFASMLAAHSMPSVARGAGTFSGARRADVVPGTRGRTSADRRLIDLIDAHFRAAGLSVRHDDPYRGGFTTAHYGRPADGWHVVQIELNRALYVDEVTCRPKPQAFDALRTVLAELVAKVCAQRL